VEIPRRDKRLGLRLQQRLILADLDGTLVEHGGNDLGSEVHDFIRSVHASGGTLVVVSARSVVDLAMVVATDSAVGLVVGSGGGVVARVGGGEVRNVEWQAELSLRGVEDLIRQLQQCATQFSGGLFLFMTADTGFKVLESSAGEVTRCEINTIAGPRPIERVYPDLLLGIEAVLGVSLLIRGTVKIACTIRRKLPVPSSWRVAIYPEYRLQNRTWIEMFPGEANKLRGAVEVVRILKAGGPVPEIVALGDSEDDIGMLRFSSESFCPESAASEVRRAATHVVSHPGGPSFVAAVKSALVGQRG
jgi:hydroxymethylpyrimidine pyrophosphatase-like HAD family hydrolase